RLLVLRQDRSVAPALRHMARTGKSPLARRHALWTLEGLNVLDSTLVRETMQDPDPRPRVQAIRLCESLVKAGRRSLVSSVRERTEDASPDVVIQALMTLHLLKVPDAAAVIRSTREASTSRGVREIAAQLLKPPDDGFGDFSLFRFTPEERQVLARG